MRDSHFVHLQEIWILLFLLGIIMLNFPFIHIFNKDVQVFGFPLLFLYFMVGWPASIVIVYFFSRNMHEKTGDDESGEGKSGP